MSDEVKIPMPKSLQEIIGSLLFASEVPLTAAELRESVRAWEAEGETSEVAEIYRTCTTREVNEALKGLEKALNVAGCGFELVCTGGTYRLQTVPSCGRYVRAMLKLDRPSRLGRASLETLAIIAYRQPITKSEIEEIRGVDVTGNLKTLMDLQVIRLVGKSELPGHPFLYGTTPLFLEHFGLANLQELNEIDPTLQRSNPRAKAESYRKPVKTEIEKVIEEKEKETGSKEQGEGNKEQAAGSREPVDSEETVQEPAAEDTSHEGDLLSGLEDDVIIDDTPDEFDDDEDEDDENEEGEEEEENEDENT